MLSQKVPNLIRKRPENELFERSDSSKSHEFATSVGNLNFQTVQKVSIANCLAVRICDRCSKFELSDSSDSTDCELSEKTHRTIKNKIYFCGSHLSFARRRDDVTAC